MESTGDKTLHWAVTRIGQVIMFWGALEALLQVLDVVTNSDLLLMLRLSLTPELGFLADPWVAVLLVGLGFGIIWKSHRPPKARKPVLSLNHDAAEPDAPVDYSLLRSAGLIMPLFLALVCGMAFGGFEWSSPNHGQVSRGTNTASARVLSGAIRRRPARTGAPGLSGPSGDQPGGGQSSETLASLTPRLTPDFDENNGPSAADVAGNPLLAQLPADPRAAARAFAYNGARKLLKTGQAPAAVDSPERRLFDKIEEAHRTQNWWLLASLSETAIKQSPQWLTPYLFAGEAYANLGKIDRAVPLLEYVRKYGAGNPDYDYATRQATQLRLSIKQRYGR